MKLMIVKGLCYKSKRRLTFKLSVHITNPLFLYYFSLAYVLLLLNFAILVREYFARMSFNFNSVSI